MSIASKTIDATNLVVAPGFIDVHSHLDFFIPIPRHAEVLETWIEQGATTIVAGNCGYSPAPINHDFEEFISTYWNFALPKDGLEFKWDTMSDYLKFLEDIGFFAQVYHGSDYYNIYFDHQLSVIRFGIMTEILRF